MTPRARVIGLGQELAGDDGVGLAVLEGLRARGVPAGVEVVAAPEEAAVVELLETPAPVVLVDAVLGAQPGAVVTLEPGDIASRALRPVSTHGLGLAQAVALARVMSPVTVSPSIRIVGVTIARAVRGARELSPEVAAAVPRAVDRVLALVAT